MLMTEYETTMVLRPELGGDAIEATLDRVRDVVKTNGGKLIAINHWGKKKLAFEINKSSRGIFVHTQYLGEHGLVAELERNLRIADSVLRYLTVRVARNIDPGKYEEKQYVRPQYEAEEVAASEEAAAPGFEEPEEFEAEAPEEDAEGAPAKAREERD
jgi:small subunit ribosomal protein S6